MSDSDKTKEELIDELAVLRQRNTKLENLLAERNLTQPADLESEPDESTLPKIEVGGINIAWSSDEGLVTFEGLPIIMLWIDTTLMGLMSGVQAMVGPERFLVALQSEGRKSVEADWQVISMFPTFEEGFAAIANIGAVAGWGNWQIISLDEDKKEARFRIWNSWEGKYQKTMGVGWGSGMLAGKMAGYCSKLFDTNCWAEQTSFIANGDEYDEFTVQPSNRTVESEIEKLLVTDKATRADLAVALQKLQQEMTQRQRVEDELRKHRDRLEEMVAERTAKLTTVNEQLRGEIDERLRAEKALQQAKDAAEEARKSAETANQAKSVFLAKMSHELRTPLNGILGYTQILMNDTTLVPEQQKGLNIIKRSGEHLLLLINDILDLTKVETGRIKLRPQPFDLPDFLANVCEMMQARADVKNLACVKEIKNIPQSVLGDEKRLRQVLVNLLGNAVKFTTKGTIALWVNRVDDNIRFLVEDTGRGISADHLEHIFDPFYQIRNHTYQSRGAGLGLAISRELVELMGGTVYVESVEGAGSKFWFDINLPEVKGVIEPGYRSKQLISGIKDKNPKILITDDDADNRAVIVDMLSPLGFVVTEAGDGVDGLNKLTEFKPDAIIVDLVMPNMNGLEMIRHVRQMPEYKNISLIVSSASSFDEDRTQSMGAGADAFLPKPVNMGQLLDTLHQQLHLEWIYSQEENGAEDAESLVLPPVEVLSKLTSYAHVGDIAAVNQLVDMLIQADPQMKPFATEIHRMTDSFQVNSLVAYLESLQD